MVTPENDVLLSVNQVAAMLGRPPGTIRQWRSKGFGPKSFKLGASVVFRRSAVLRFIDECEAAKG